MINLLGEIEPITAPEVDSKTFVDGDSYVEDQIYESPLQKFKKRSSVSVVKNETVEAKKGGPSSVATQVKFSPEKGISLMSKKEKPSVKETAKKKTNSAKSKPKTMQLADINEEDIQRKEELESSKGLLTQKIVAICVGAAVFCVIFILVIIKVVKKRQRKRKLAEPKTWVPPKPSMRGCNIDDDLEYIRDEKFYRPRSWSCISDEDVKIIPHRPQEIAHLKDRDDSWWKTSSWLDFHELPAEAYYQENSSNVNSVLSDKYGHSSYHSQTWDRVNFIELPCAKNDQYSASGLGSNRKDSITESLIDSYTTPSTLCLTSQCSTDFIVSNHLPEIKHATQSRSRVYSISRPVYPNKKLI
ncbi:hypothetical protein BY996DRAFT_8683314 [Phakopsora pachyrhizi]|uniref:Expressed protein n=1 Tax=Phakopsora pachyrhizi TaxID=170000 RepID=A0AAV0BJV5_PHAPC|nr:hypothetical protein BY996DRAFT_8683314 [Phakopsora pachyrhizi]CAH7687533.1 expressed protein [Phakopsora pachyrhizi]